MVAAAAAAGVPQVSRASKGKAGGDRLSWFIRDWASVAAAKGVSTPASALCQALVELDKILATVETSSVKYAAGEQFHAVVCLLDVVARGVLLCLEDEATATATSAGGGGGGGGGRYDRSLDTLRGLVRRATEVAARLCAKRRLGLLSTSLSLSRKKHLRLHLERDLEAVSGTIYRFAASHTPELATDDHRYVSKPAPGTNWLSFQIQNSCK